MGGVRQPFIYEAVKNDDGRFQSTTFDPKAVTRASYEQKKPKPTPNGPLVSINRHPDAHVVPNLRNPYRPMGRRTKSWIMHMRSVQLVCRVLELVGAVGLLVLMILLNKVAALEGWILRITLGVAAVHCVYAAFHLSRPAGGRTPGSSAAYHVFASVSDLAILPLYAYGALSARNNGDKWGTLLQDQRLVAAYFVPGVYYGLIGAGGLHVLSLSISLWLSIMFRRILNMPPDMNPLEGHLTSRAHKRNKSSMTASSYAGSEKRLESSLGDHRLSALSQADLSRPPSIPFMHTRNGSQTSISTRDSRLDLPSRQYQITPGNSSPRSSITPRDLKRMSAPPPRSSNRNSYTDISLRETTSRPNSSYTPPSRPSTGSRPSSGNVAHRAEHVPASPTQMAAQPRAAKFTEAWYASESLINRTQERTRAMNQMNAANKRRAYEALNPAYDNPDDSGSENDENGYSSRNNHMAPEKDDDDHDGHHPNPLRSNPTAAPPRRPYTPYRPPRSSALSEISLNDRRVMSGSNDIADEERAVAGGGRNRDSSIQPELFFSKPYGLLKPGTPPVMIGGGDNGGGGNGIKSNNGRQVSSGNDYDLGGSGFAATRRNVSGKIAEEGRAGERWSRYSTLNE